MLFKKLDTEKRRLFKEKMHKIMFETATPQGRKFDLYLLSFILFSILILMIESLPNLSNTVRLVFYILEWILSLVFLVEYLMRIYVSPKPLRYIFSPWGIIDLLSILPVLLLAFSNHAHFFRIIRILRLIRIFKIFRVSKFTAEAYSLYYSLRASAYKIYVFMFFVVMLSIIMGGIMFIFEGRDNEDFNSIPKSIYWAIVTITTVGFGDVTPMTNLGKTFASIMMLLGYAIIAVPTGIVSLEMFKQSNKNNQATQKKCISCQQGSPKEALYCNRCGSRLERD